VSYDDACDLSDDKKPEMILIQSRGFFQDEIKWNDPQPLFPWRFDFVKNGMIYLILIPPHEHRQES
jgi:hypothetical protein